MKHKKLVSEGRKQIKVFYIDPEKDIDVKSLKAIGISSEAIHGNKSQNARQRALTGFKDRTIRILVATDIASRGIDVDKLTHVINYELPEVPETYVHRIGRTGRAGEDGTAFSFCSSEELTYLKDINKLLKHNIKEMNLAPIATFASKGDGGKKPKSTGSSSGRKFFRRR